MNRRERIAYDETVNVATMLMTKFDTLLDYARDLGLVALGERELTEQERHAARVFCRQLAAQMSNDIASTRTGLERIWKSIER